MAITEADYLAQLRDALTVAISESWTRAKRDHSDETIYAFVLYTEAQLGYAAPSFNTEEALGRAAEDEEELEDLRWSPDDWEYHLENEDLFEDAQAILTELEKLADDDEDAARDRRWKVFMDSLATVDRAGHFGTGEARNQLTINILWGDQDVVEHILSARELNPRTSYLRFARDQFEWLKDWHDEVESTPSDETGPALKRIRETIALVEKDLAQ